MTLEHEVTSLVSKKNTALDVWLALHSKFEGKGLTALSMLATQFWTYWMLLDQDIMAQVQEIKSIALKLSSLGYPLSEEYQAMGILMALPPEWSLICSIILNKTGPFTLQDTVNSLLEYENTLKQDQGVALAACQGQKLKSSPPKSGHSKVICSNCKKEGHSIERCWSVGGGAKGQGLKKKQSKSSVKSKHGQGQVNMSKDNSSSSVSHSILILHSKEDVLLLRDTPSHSNSVYFIIDSGASTHMCPDRSYFSSYMKLNTPKCIWVADDQMINAIGIGNIKVKLFLDGQSHPGTLKDVLHLPSLSEPLLSTTQMTNGRITVILKSDHADLVNDKTRKVFTTAYRCSQLYKLCVEIIRPEHVHAAQGHPSSKASLALWH